MLMKLWKLHEVDEADEVIYICNSFPNDMKYLDCNLILWSYNMNNFIACLEKNLHPT